MVNAANARLGLNDTTGPSMRNPLGSGSDNTGMALANALDKSGNTAGGTTGKDSALIDMTNPNATAEVPDRRSVTGNALVFRPINDDSSEHSRTENQFVFKE